MKKSILSIRLFSLIIFVTLLSSCASQKYESLIGVESSSLLVGVNINQLLDKSAYKEQTSKETQDQILDVLIQNKQSRAILNPLFYYPRQSGLDYSKPLYFVVEGGLKTVDIFSLYGAVRDYKKLISFLSTSEVFEEQIDATADLNGFRFYKGIAEDTYLFVNRHILVLTSSPDISRITKPKTPLKKHKWSAALKPKDDMVVVYNMENFQKLVHRFIIVKPDLALLDMIPAAPSSLYASSSLNFEQGKVLLTQKLYAEDKQGESYIENLDNNFTKTRGTWNSYIPIDPLFYFEAGVKGDQIKEFLNEVPQLIRIFLGMDEDSASRLKSALSSVDGDLVLSLNSLEFKDFKPDFDFCGLVESSPELFDTLLRELEESPLSSLIKERQTDKFSFGDNELMLYITRTKKGLMLSNKAELSESTELPKTENISRARYLGGKSKDFNFVIDIQKIISNPIMQLGLSGVPKYRETGFDKLLSDMDYLKTTGSTSSHQTELVMTTKADNTLKLILSVILKASGYANLRAK